MEKSIRGQDNLGLSFQRWIMHTDDSLVAHKHMMVMPNFVGYFKYRTKRIKYSSSIKTPDSVLGQLHADSN